MGESSKRKLTAKQREGRARLDRMYAKHAAPKTETPGMSELMDRTKEREDRDRIDLHAVANPPGNGGAAAADPEDNLTEAGKHFKASLNTTERHKREVDARFARRRGERPPKTFEDVHREFMRLAKPARKGRRDFHARIPESLLLTAEYNACGDVELRVLGILLLYCYRHTGVASPGYKTIVRILSLEEVENAWLELHPKAPGEPLRQSPTERRIQRALSRLIVRGLILRKSAGCKSHAAEYLIARNQSHIELFKSLIGCRMVTPFKKLKGCHAETPFDPGEQV